jgi:uncharacterized protein
MTNSVKRQRTSRRIASEGEQPQPGAGRNSIVGLAAACVGAAALATSSASFGQIATPQAQATTAPAAPAQDQTTPTAGPTTPPGMVRYDHPIMVDGHLVLWRGAWRSRVKAAVQAPSEARSVAAPAPAPPPQRQHGLAVLADPDDSCATRIAGELAAALHVDGGGAHVLAGRVSVSALATAVQGDSADLAIAPLDALLAHPEASAGWRERAPYIARLPGEPVEIIASRDITDVRQLAGRNVGYGPTDSADATSATIIFGALGIAPQPAYAPLAAELSDLSAGKLAAVVVVDGRCSSAIASFGGDHRFHEVAVHWSPALKMLYAPARLSAKDRPNLIDAEQKIDSINAPRALIALDAAPDTPRAAAVAAMTKSFFDGFDRLQEPGKDEAWRAVNLAASVPWPRLKGAQAWVDDVATPANSSLEAFRSVARSAASATDGPAPQDSDRLFDSLMRWRGTEQ